MTWKGPTPYSRQICGHCHCRQSVRRQERMIVPLCDAGRTVVIPSKRCRKQQRADDKHLYRTRHLIEQFSNKPKQYHSVATRYGKTARNLLDPTHFAAAAAVILLN